MWCVFDSVCELFGETIRNIFVVVILLLNVMEGFSVSGGALLPRLCIVDGLPKNVRVVPVIPVCI